VRLANEVVATAQATGCSCRADRAMKWHRQLLWESGFEMSPLRPPGRTGKLVVDRVEAAWIGAFAPSAQPR